MMCKVSPFDLVLLVWGLAILALAVGIHLPEWLYSRWRGPRRD